MAGRSQLPVQIMENQTRFDLNAAVENWRNELAAQPNLASDDRRELETHLRDAIAGFQQRGLNDEESFWLARRRVGQPQQLGEEFVKANPTAVWRERVFWMAAGTLGFGFLYFILAYTNETLLYFFSGYRLYETTLLWISMAQILAVAAFLATGWFARQSPTLRWFFQTRLRLMVMLVLVAAFQSVIQTEVAALGDIDGIYSNWPFSAWTNFLSNAHWFFPLLVLLVWLMPAQNQKTPKRA